MLKIQNLTKIFKTKKGINNTALDHVSFSLPDNGLAFIVGKSGSGKTTLLSLIGGLDNATSGNIFIDNKDITKLSHKEADNFRNKTIGYIYQDYQLIENLTIYENLKLVLDLQNSDELSRINDALKNVGLEGYESRYPKELSGGQKQRVAIARVIVKNPSIILADEPTGNLDINTTIQIINLLKELAKTKLIIFVSHDIIEAKAYADYLIYLDNGKIKECYKKSKANITAFDINDNTLYIPLNKHISEEKRKNLIAKINAKTVKNIIQYNDEYIPINEEFISNNELMIENKKHLKWRDSIKYGLKFFKSERLKSTIYSFLSSILIAFIGLFILLTSVNPKNVLIDYENNYSHHALVTHSDIYTPSDDCFFYKKDTIDPNYESIYRKHGYTGKIYEANNFTNPYDNRYYTPFNRKDLDFIKIIYTEESYLNNLFEDGNDVQYIVKRDAPLDDAYYITDFFADSYLLKNYQEINQENYNNLLNKILCLFNSKIRINGIINTHYREIYPEILPHLKNESLNRDEVYQVAKLPIAENFYNDAMNLYLSIYTFNKDTYYKWIRSDYVKWMNSSSLTLNTNGINIPFKKTIYKASYDNTYNLKEDEIIIDYLNYNLLTNKNIYVDSYLKLDDPLEVTLKAFLTDSNIEGEILNEQKLKIVGVSHKPVYFNDNNFYNLFDSLNQITDLYFSDPNQINAIINANKELGYTISSVAEGNIQTYCRYLNTMKEIFSFFLICLLIVIILALYYYNKKILHNKIHDVGIMKSLGARDQDIISMLSVNLTETLVKMLIFFNILEVILVKYVNIILVKSIKLISNDFSIMSQNFINYISINGNFIILMNLVIIISMLLAFLVPFIKLRFIKPTNIVKAKE